ncbi:hypothetical protein E2C01_017281 [Portunus trituberculatus]|uniref:Uncharacterized protein n=1 Tax=Portunus trituberculatus TaxID=210409 RepID=A0A5B7DSG0_PORTR|nr:hypothetical protein [Portunus trituberculatus]
MEKQLTRVAARPDDNVIERPSSSMRRSTSRPACEVVTTYIMEKTAPIGVSYTEQWTIRQCTGGDNSLEQVFSWTQMLCRASSAASTVRQSCPGWFTPDLQREEGKSPSMPVCPSPDSQYQCRPPPHHCHEGCHHQQGAAAVVVVSLIHTAAWASVGEGRAGLVRQGLTCPYKLHSHFEHTAQGTAGRCRATRSRLTVAQQVVDERDLGGVVNPEHLEVVGLAEVVEAVAVIRRLLVGEAVAGLEAPREVVQAALIRHVHLGTTADR